MCLKRCIPELPWKTDKDFKSFLGLTELAKVPVSSFDVIQNELPKYRLVLSGDYTYASTSTSHHVVNISLYGGHYKLVTPPTKTRGIALTEKKPLVYNKNCNGSYRCYNGASYGEYNMSAKTFKKHRAIPRSSQWTLIPNNKGSSLRHTWKDWIKSADSLKHASDGLINLYKTGTPTKTAMELFNHYTKNIHAENITQVEADWITAAATGALIYGKEYTGPATKYDVVSLYPSLMANTNMMFPHSSGRFLKLESCTENSDLSTRFSLQKIPYGIYHCKVQKDSSCLNSFRWNRNNYYTSYDILNAFELGLEVNLIEDGKPNALVWDDDQLIPGDVLFGEYVNCLFSLKQKSIPKAKNILNCLWGVLCQQKTNRFVIKGEFQLKEHHHLISIQPKGDIYIVVTRDANSPFATNWARLKPFLLSMGRLYVARLIREYREHVVRIHTDGFLVDGTYEGDIEVGTALGQLRHESHCDNVSVENSMKVIGTFQ